VPDSGIPAEVVDRARVLLGNNSKPSSTGERFWELSGGVFVCCGCGYRMQSDRKRRSTSTDRYHHYYKCPNRCPRPGIIERCPGSRKFHKAEETEALVWDFVSGLLKDPTRLKVGLEKRIEEERSRSAHGNPDREAKTWLRHLDEIEAKRSRFQDMAAEGLISFEELRGKLHSLDESRKAAEEELKCLRAHSERVETLKHDKDALLASLEGAIPELLEGLPSEGRNRIYKMLNLKVEALPDDPLRLTGALVGGLGVWVNEPRPWSGPTPTCPPPTPASSPAARPT
jgi:hypothetical protein